MHGAEYHLLPRLRALLDRFREFDLRRPPSMSVDEYLEFLSAEEVVSHQIAETTRGLYHQARYGSAGLSEDQIEQLERDVGRALEAFARRDDASRQLLADRLHGFPTAPPTQDLAKVVGTPHNSIAIPARMDDDPLWTDSKEFATASPPPQRIWMLAAIGAVVWTIVVTAATHWNHSRIEDVLELARQHFSTGVTDEDLDRQIHQLRDRLAQTPSGPARRQLFNSLGTLHAQRGEDARAIVAYYQAVTLDGDAPLAALFPTRGSLPLDFDPEVMNNLAWLLLTTDDPACHSPQQALPLARQAYRMQPTAAVADTLAEAYYQNGQYDRAVGLERRAIDLRPPNLDFYERQLRKFEAARDAAAQTASTR